jgi:3-oxoacyl-[acyl-carrier protein] reductase
MSEVDRPLAGRVALVSGGSRGMGAAIAQRLARSGADVVITYASDADAAAAVTERIRSHGVDGDHVRAQAADAAQVGAAVEHTVATYGRLDVLLNNAGVSPQGLISDVSDEDFAAVVAVNVHAPFVAARAASAHMSDGGRIINIGSVWGERVPYAGISLYAMSKAALAAFTRAWSRDLGPRGITVNCVQPGPIDTDMNPADGQMSAVLTPATALGRYGTPTEVADVVTFLAGPDSSYVTGAVLNVDGGFNA